MQVEKELEKSIRKIEKEIKQLVTRKTTIEKEIMEKEEELKKYRALKKQQDKILQSLMQLKSNDDNVEEQKEEQEVNY